MQLFALGAQALRRRRARPGAGSSRRAQAADHSPSPALIRRALRRTRAWLSRCRGARLCARVRHAESPESCYHASQRTCRVALIRASDRPSIAGQAGAQPCAPTLAVAVGDDRGWRERRSGCCGRPALIPPSVRCAARAARRFTRESSRSLKRKLCPLRGRRRFLLYSCPRRPRGSAFGRSARPLGAAGGTILPRNHPAIVPGAAARASAPGGYNPPSARLVPASGSSSLARACWPGRASLSALSTSSAYGPRFRSTYSIQTRPEAAPAR